MTFKILGPGVVPDYVRTYVQVTYLEFIATKFSSAHVQLMSSKTLRCLAAVLNLFCISLDVPRGVNGCTGDAWYHVLSYALLKCQATCSVL